MVNTGTLVARYLSVNTHFNTNYFTYMVRSFYLTLAAVFCTVALNAQTSEVQQWAEANPTVLLIENADATPELLKSLDAKKADYIIYFNELTISDIEHFETKIKPVEVDIADKDAMEIKLWLAEHKDVKIIKRSFFDQLESSKQDLYESSGALILIGEEITLEDIHNFQ